MDQSHKRLNILHESSYSPSLRYAQLAAIRCGFDFTMLDSHSGYLCSVSNAHGSALLGGGSISSWPVNNATAAGIANDKGFTSLVLKEKKLRVPREETIFLSTLYQALRAPGREREDVGRLSESFRWPLIAKPNNGSRGAFVQLCADLSELDTHLNKMAERFIIALLQDYIHGDEYRVFVFNGEAVFSYKKYRGVLMADGIRTVRELIQDQNIKLIGSGLDPINIDTNLMLNSLRDQNLTVSSVPSEGAPLNIGVRANLSAGGRPEDFTITPPKHLATAAIKATQAIGLYVAGVDLIIPHDQEAGEPIVLEVNANPSISSLESVGQLDLAINIYERLLNTLLT